MRYDIENYL
jgi:hypothetical protein